MNLNKLIDKAIESRFYLWLLNKGLSRMVPFNAPHKLRITNIGDNRIEVCWPYIRKNLNHIKGLHACGLATLTEFTSGFSILRKISPKKYRIIMKSINMAYHFQGKSDAFASLEMSDDFVRDKISVPLKENGLVDLEMTIKTNDKDGNLLSTGKVIWQIKSWEKVKTKL